MEMLNYPIHKIQYPLLFLPKALSSIEGIINQKDDLLMDGNVLGYNLDGTGNRIYSGYLNVKVVDDYAMTVESCPSTPDTISMDTTDENIVYNQSKVWIDPATSPYVNIPTEVPQLSKTTNITNNITLHQNNAYFTQNVYNFNDRGSCPLRGDCDSRGSTPAENILEQDAYDLYGDADFECGVFLPELSDGIQQVEDNARKEEIQQSSALKQLLSTNKESSLKQQKTVLYLGQNSGSGRTIHNIKLKDPNLECTGDVATEIVIDDSQDSSRQKIYQCDKCKQIFNQISAFRQHVVNHKNNDQKKHAGQETTTYMCPECGKTLKTLEKYERHCNGHGNPELECDKCFKVFATKFTLKAHQKLHNRKYRCELCPKTYDKEADFKKHLTKSHKLSTSQLNTQTNEKQTNNIENKGKRTTNEKGAVHNANNAKTANNTNNAKNPKYSNTANRSENVNYAKNENNTKSANKGNHTNNLNIANNTNNDINANIVSNANYPNNDINVDRCVSQSEENWLNNNDVSDKIKEADSIIAKVIASKVFLLKQKESRRQRVANKSCEICLKRFDRISDLKRHIIEHILKSTLAKNPLNKGILHIQCEVCYSATFSKIDAYKAHLREHAKLTLYKCTFCDKSFSDSSNFSKHKKVHSATPYQCDVCHRKFHSKRMISKHMQYHFDNPPVSCKYCDKVFYYNSALNKHVKLMHMKQTKSKFHCQFCRQEHPRLKDKWDHEWAVHNARKSIIDCLTCEAKFRKYSDLKKHCWTKHGIKLPLAKQMKKNELY